MARTIPSFPEKTVLEATDELLLSDTVSGTSKKVTADNIASGVNKGDLSADLISADADNLLEQGTDNLLKVDADTLNSGDADNLMQVVSNKLKVDGDNMISADADNALIVGTDDKLYSPATSIPDNSLLPVKFDSTGANDGDVATADGAGNVAYEALPTATTTVSGVIEKATNAEVTAETVDKYPDSANMKYHEGIVKAWVNFNGTGTVAIRDSYNVTSITDNGTGLYDVNLTNAVTVNAAATFGGLTNSSNTAAQGGCRMSGASTVNVACASNTTTLADWEFVSVAVLGDLA